MRNTPTLKATQREKDLTEKMIQCSELNSMLLNLFYTVSHNLNSYTGNIKMLLEVMDEEHDPIDNKVNLGYLRTVAEDLNKTIADLSQIVYVQNNLDVVKQSLQLNHYLNKVEKVINGYRTNSRVSFINNVPDDVFVNYNPAYLESVLLNFSTNAIKYAHKERFPELQFTFSEQDRILTIADNGLGIDLKRYGDSLFGLNQTFHQHENACGLGLYITKYQIESMRGMVTVDSKVGQGTTFKIHFKD